MNSVGPCPITHFEIYGNDPARLADFYSILLGWQLEKASGVDYWRIPSGGTGTLGIGGGVTYRPEGAPNGWLCYAHVPSLDEAIDTALRLGGKLLRPKTAVPKTAWYAMLADPEGNVFSIWQPDGTAFPEPEPD